MEECIALISATLQMDGGKKNRRLVIEYMWNPLCTNSSFPQAVGEDAVNTYWRDSDLRTSCHT